MDMDIKYLRYFDLMQTIGTYVEKHDRDTTAKPWIGVCKKLIANITPEHFKCGIIPIAYDLLKNIYSTRTTDCNFGNIIGLKHSDCISEMIGIAIGRRDIAFLEWLATISEGGITYDILYAFGQGRWLPCFDDCSRLLKSPMIVETPTTICELSEKLSALGIECIM